MKIKIAQVFILGFLIQLLSFNVMADEIKVDVPVKLEQAKVVFNMDHAAFTGDMPIGIRYMNLLSDRFVEHKTKGEIVAVFHGEAGYMVLNDKAYNAARKVTTGNPYKELIANLIKKNVEIDMCAITMKGNKWTNEDLLPNIKVTTGAILRLIELNQKGFSEIHP